MGSSPKAVLRGFRRAHAWREFKVGVAKVPWEEASDLHRSCLPAWHADFTDQSYRHLRDIYLDLYDAVIARGRHQPIPLRQRAQAAAQGAAGQAPAPAQPQQPSTPSSPSSTTTVSTIKAAAPSAAVTQTAAGPGEIRLQLQAQRRPELQLKARPIPPPIRLQLRPGGDLRDEEEDTAGKASAFPCTATEGVIPTPKIQNSPQGCSSKRIMHVCMHVCTYVCMWYMCVCESMCVCNAM